MPFIVVKSKTLKLVLILSLAVILLFVCAGGVNATSVFLGYSNKECPIYSVDRDDNYVSLTFDAAWGADKTESILKILQSYNIKATFFLVGFWVEKYPEESKLIADDGMEIGSHSNTHPDMAKLSADDITLELNTAKNTIVNATGVTPTLFRAPYGSYNNRLISTAKSLGYTPIQWSVDTLDWKGYDVKTIVTRVTSKINSGSIILFHNNSDHVLDALPVVIDRLLMDGYKFTTVGDLVYKDNYYIDHTGMQRQSV